MDWLIIKDWVPLLAVLGGLISPTIATIVGISLANANAVKARVAVKEVAKVLEANGETTNEKLNEIHVLVNSRLTEALKKIDRLEAKLLVATGELPTGEPPASGGPLSCP